MLLLIMQMKGCVKRIAHSPEVPRVAGELSSETITRRDFPALGKISYMTTIDETFTWRGFQPMLC